MDKMKKHFTKMLLVVAALMCRPVFAEDLALHGFIEAAYGVKVSDDSTKRDNFNLLEQRAQLKTAYYFRSGYLGEKGASLDFKGDLTVDE